MLKMNKLQQKNKKQLKYNKQMKIVLNIQKNKNSIQVNMKIEHLNKYMIMMKHMYNSYFKMALIVINL